MTHEEFIAEIEKMTVLELNDLVKALEEKGYEILSDDLAMVPMTTTRLTDPDQLKQMGKLLDSLEDNDDVQNVWHSLENEEDLPE